VLGKLLRRRPFCRKKAPMQISKSFLVVCAVAYCAALLPLRAADTEAQIKAREALEKKLKELETQSPEAAPPPSVVAPQPKAKAAPKAAPAPVAEPAPAAPPPMKTTTTGAAPTPAWRSTPPAQWTPTPAVAPAARQGAGPVLLAPPPADAESIAKAREALRQKMNELETTPGQAAPQPIVTAPALPKSTVPVTPAPPVAPPPVTAPAVQPVPPAPQPPPVAAPIIQPEPKPAVQSATKPTLVAPPPVDAESIAKAREALDQKMKELAAQPAAQTVGTAPGQKAPKKPGVQPFPPLKGPPPAVAADKQQRLDELLRKYKADELTPEEYHLQRAKIVGEP
jgi:hypothetical protein